MSKIKIVAIAVLLLVLPVVSTCPAFGNDGQPGDGPTCVPGHRCP
jgi:hypothetical protein